MIMEDLYGKGKSEKDLIQLLKKGNHKAFNSLYAYYWKQVYNFCRIYVSKDNAEEILQEVFIKVWLGRTVINENRNFKGYLFVITRNEIFDWFRKKKISDNQILPLVSALESYYGDAEEEATLVNMREYLDKLIEKLPPKSKMIFNLSRKSHLTNSEISDRLHISVKAVEAGITRSLKFIRENMELLILFIMM